VGRTIQFHTARRLSWLMVRTAFAGGVAVAPTNIPLGVVPDDSDVDRTAEVQLFLLGNEPCCSRAMLDNHPRVCDTLLKRARPH